MSTYDRKPIKCPQCDGLGIYKSEVCDKCSGRGYILCYN